MKILGEEKKCEQYEILYLIIIMNYNNKYEENNQRGFSLFPDIKHRLHYYHDEYKAYNTEEVEKHAAN